MWERTSLRNVFRPHKSAAQVKKQHLANITGRKMFILSMSRHDLPELHVWKAPRGEWEWKSFIEKEPEHKQENWLFDQIAPIDWVNIKLTSSVHFETQFLSPAPECDEMNEIPAARCFRIADFSCAKCACKKEVNSYRVTRAGTDAIAQQLKLISLLTRIIISNC